MKRRLGLFIFACVVCAACNESKPFEVQPGVCEAFFTPACISENSYLGCMDGLKIEMLCPENTVCSNGKCETPCSESLQPYCEGNTVIQCKDGHLLRTNCTDGCSDGACNSTPAECEDTLKPYCEDDIRVSCESGNLHRTECKNGCVEGECSSDTAECEDTLKPYCENENRVTCASGKLQRTPCANGCENGECKNSGNDPVCGNNKIEDGENCDGRELGTLTCYDVEGTDSRATYTGKPECNSDCKTVSIGTCATTQCGNGKIQPEHGEICEVVDGVSKFLDTPTCDNYQSGKQWIAGGMPECSDDCKSYKRGTCRLAAQPMGSIQECQLVSLEPNVVDKTVTMHGRIIADAGTPDTMITGQMRCIQHDYVDTTMPYAYSQKIDASVIDCTDCGDDEYLLSATLDYSAMNAGVYDCIFVANAEGGMNSYYMCDTTMGYPIPLENGVPDEYQRYDFEIIKPVLDGTLLAQWEFKNYKKNDETETAAADDGVFASKSTIKLSTGEKIKMLSGAAGYPDAGASITGPSRTDQYDENAPYFQIITSATGYRNVRIQFKVAGSGSNEKLITLAYILGDIVTKAGEPIQFDDTNNYHQFPITELTGTDNLNTIEIRIYPNSIEGESNATVRIDDVYITGEAM